ncbi:12525_t:CDS:2, partial [Ambispora gerdemannii]
MSEFYDKYRQGNNQDNGNTGKGNNQDNGNTGKGTASSNNKSNSTSSSLSSVTGSPSASASDTSDQTITTGSLSPSVTNGAASPSSTNTNASAASLSYDHHFGREVIGMLFVTFVTALNKSIKESRRFDQAIIGSPRIPKKCQKSNAKRLQVYKSNK